jgi:hypothetical protein
VLRGVSPRRLSAVTEFEQSVPARQGQFFIAPGPRGDKGMRVRFGLSYGLRIATVAPTVKKTTPVPLSDPKSPRREVCQPRCGSRTEPGGVSPRSPRWPRSQPLSRAAQRRIGAWRRQPQVTVMATIRSPASYPTRAIERQSSEVWCRPPGLGRAGDDRSFLAWSLRHQPSICLPIRVLAEPREITLHASRPTRTVAGARSESSPGPRG